MTDPQADNFLDHDSTLGSEYGSDEGSLDSEVLAIREENMRSYHNFRKEREYLLPNDERERDRLDLQHHVFELALDGKLFTCPVKNIDRVLDVGTGTGIWAMDCADAYPNAVVVGVDLSVIQPYNVPPNLSFIIDDLQDTWLFKDKFAFIHCRNMIFAFSDWPFVLKQSFQNLQSGGYIEIVDIAFPVQADDDSIMDTALEEWSSNLLEASRKAGKPLDNAKLHKERLLNAGFEDVVEVIHKLPLCSWPEKEELKLLGAWNFANVGENVDTLSMALFTRQLGWPMREVLLTSAVVKRDIANLKIHAYFNMHVVYGRKPVDQEA